MWALTCGNEQTVKRLIVDQPDIMPYYGKNGRYGAEYPGLGKRQITVQVTTAILQGRASSIWRDRLQVNMCRG